MDFSAPGNYTDYSLRKVLKACITGDKGVTTAKEFCRRVRIGLDKYDISFHDVRETLSALFELQVEVALDAFVLRARRSIQLFFADSFRSGSLMDKIEPEIVCNWADKDKGTRYKLLGKFLSVFESRDDENAGKASSLFLFVLNRAPDKFEFLGRFESRIFPSTWWGSLAESLITRRASLEILDRHTDPDVKRWMRELDENLRTWVEEARKRDLTPEESFE
jgi:hypothetical protein